MTQDDHYQVGYGRPPKHTRFQRGKSGNPAGRPKKATKAAFNIAEILSEPLTVLMNGRRREINPMEVSFYQMLKKVQEKEDVSSLLYLIDKFIQYGVFVYGVTERRSGCIFLPTLSMARRMADILLERFGIPPWTQKQVDIGRVEYLSTRTPEEEEDDKKWEYPALEQT